MTRTLADSLARVTPEDVRRFTDTVDIRDAPAFAAELEAFFHERLEALDVSGASDAPSEAEHAEPGPIRSKFSLRAAQRWVPRETDIQRGRAAMVAAFNQPHNLPLADFAQLAGKSRQQIYKDIDARLLLALSVGPRGQKLPDWQLEPAPQQLTRAVLAKAGRVDSWTLYRVLSEPLESLGGRSPVEAVTAESVNDVVGVVCSVLDLH